MQEYTHVHLETIKVKHSSFHHNASAGSEEETAAVQIPVEREKAPSSISSARKDDMTQADRAAWKEEEEGEEGWKSFGVPPSLIQIAVD